MKVKSDYRSKFSNLSNIGRKKPEKYQGFNGIRTRDLREIRTRDLRGSHGFESRWSRDIFKASSFQLLKLENLLRWSLRLPFHLLTTFTAPYGRYIWRRLLFGLSSARRVRGHTEHHRWHPGIRSRRQRGRSSRRPWQNTRGTAE